MENNSKKTGNRKPSRPSKAVEIKDNVIPISPVIDKHAELIDEKVSQIISLQNSLNANERMLDELNIKIKDYSKQVMELKSDNVRLRNLHTNLDYNCKKAYEQLSRVPQFIKWLYNIR